MLGFAGRAGSFPGILAIRSGAVVFATADTTAGLVMNKPTILGVGDLMVACMCANFGGSGIWSESTGTWTKVYDRGSAGAQCYFIKTATGSEPATYTFTNTNSNTGSGTILVIPNGAYDTVGANGSTADPSVATSITVSQNESLLIGMASTTNAPITITSSQMSTVLLDNDGSKPSFGIFSQNVNAGATGTRSFGMGGTSSNNSVLLSVKLVPLNGL